MPDQRREQDGGQSPWYNRGMGTHKRKKTPWARLAVEFAIGVALVIVLAMPHKSHPWINVCVVVVWIWLCAAASYRFWRDSRQVPTDPQIGPLDSN
jgi:hypothetical protein